MLVVAAGVQPSEVRGLTLLESEAIIEAAKKFHRAK